jgi:hypothetical protein
MENHLELQVKGPATLVQYCAEMVSDYILFIGWTCAEVLNTLVYILYQLLPNCGPRNDALPRDFRGLEDFVEITGTVYNLSLEAAYPEFLQSVQPNLLLFLNRSRSLPSKSLLVHHS